MSDEARGALSEIDHIVVLMMENRSFDHMLGYLSLDGAVPGVDGLTLEMGCPDSKGTFQPVAPLGKRLIHQKVLDPGHGRKDVTEQLGESNDGFVRNFEKALERHRGPDDPPVDPTLVLGYQEAHDVPVYDYIARNFTVCDRWFSSVPGPTWDNRLYATTGGTGESVGIDAFGDLPDWLRDLFAEKVADAPIYDRRAFTRELGDDDWRWYSHDPGTLRLIDERYRDSKKWRDDNFSHFDRRTIFEWRCFIDDARAGKLPKVSWIDPNFVDLRVVGPPGSNDDHPPSRVMLGQELVLTVLESIASRREQWERTLLLITYDEHGGFYDHVPPPPVGVEGDPEERYGVRVPALVVCPRAPKGACHVQFDHTSIIATILRAFADDPDRALRAMGPRAQQANHLGDVLTGEPLPPPSESDLAGLRDAVREWKERAYDLALLEPPKWTEQVTALLDDRRENPVAARELVGEAVSELQADIIDTARLLRASGIPPGKP